MRLVLFNFLSLMGRELGDSFNSSPEMVTAKSVRCLTAPSRLVFLFVFGVAVGVVLLEALETLLIRSVLPDPDSLQQGNYILS